MLLNLLNLLNLRIGSKLECRRTEQRDPQC